MNSSIIHFNSILKSKDDLLKLSKKILDKEDYQDILCGILDFEIYETLDEDLKQIINNYFNTF